MFLYTYGFVHRLYKNQVNSMPGIIKLVKLAYLLCQIFIMSFFFFSYFIYIYVYYSLPVGRENIETYSFLLRLGTPLLNSFNTPLQNTKAYLGIQKSHY